VAQLKLYVKSWCPWCISAKLYLNKRGYRFDEVDVNRDASAFDEMKRLSSQSYTPTLVADGRVLADFGTDELEVFLKQHSINP
jgi:glutaredoxin 3